MRRCSSSRRRRSESRRARSSPQGVVKLHQSLLPWVLGAVIVAALSVAAPAQACSCKPMAPPAVAAERAEVIFVATPQPMLLSSLPGTVLKVTRVYKGTVGAEVNLERTDCPSPVDVVTQDAPSPGAVLIYGYRMVHGPIGPDMCSRSRLLKDAAEDIAFLDKTFKATEPTPSAGSTPSAQGAPAPPAPSASSSSSSPAADPSEAPAAAPSAVPPGPRSGCACTSAGSTEEPAHPAATIAIAALALIARRRRTRVGPVPAAFDPL
jgi:MYXO-CTERM domain-containing protein